MLVVRFTVVFLVSSFTGSKCHRARNPQTPSSVSVEMNEFHVNDCEKRYFENKAYVASKDLPQRRTNPRSADEELMFRLTDARKVEIEDVPYTLAYGYECSGTIIHSWWALTCAHCGSWDKFVFGGSSVFKKSTVLGVCAHYIHPKYQSKFNQHEDDYDLQLLLMNDQFPKLPTFVPIPIASVDTKELAPKSYFTLTGWGMTGERRVVNGTWQVAPMAEKLRKLDVPLMSDTDCRTYIKNSGYYQPSDRMFCVGYTNCCGKGACDGDSGGPAVMDGELYGIISFGVGCGDDLPTIATMVSLPEMKQWIRFVTKIPL